MVLARGFEVSHESVRAWEERFAPVCVGFGSDSEAEGQGRKKSGKRNDRYTHILSTNHPQNAGKKGEAPNQPVSA
jgi:hypothetical protein